MFKEDDTIIYGAQGVCRVGAVTQMSFDGGSAAYYVLKPIYDEKSTIFVPVNNDTLTGRMRRILSATEVYEVIKAIPDEDTELMLNDNSRKDRFKEILDSGNRLELIKFVKAIYQHGQNRRAEGKKLCLVDERFMKDAEKVLYDEFAFVLKIKRDQVLPFIMEQIDINEKNL